MRRGAGGISARISTSTALTLLRRMGVPERELGAHDGSGWMGRRGSRSSVRIKMEAWEEVVKVDERKGESKGQRVSEATGLKYVAKQ